MRALEWQGAGAKLRERSDELDAITEKLAALSLESAVSCVRHLPFLDFTKGHRDRILRPRLQTRSMNKTSAEGGIRINREWSHRHLSVV